jgi:hypothetical protein
MSDIESDPPFNGQDDEAAQLWDDFEQKDQVEKRRGDMQ